MDPALRLSPGQERLTPAQEAEARRFAEERIAAQLSTAPVDEPHVERLVRQAYVVAGLPPPRQIHWVDGPFQLVAALMRGPVEGREGACIWKRAEANVDQRVWASVSERVEASVRKDLAPNVWKDVWASVSERVEEHVYERVWERVEAGMWECVWASVDKRGWAERARACESARVGERAPVEARAWECVYQSVWDFAHASVKAYQVSAQMASCRFYDTSLAPNALHAFARFNELVSGYWLEAEVALLVRRPGVLARDLEGRLHSATGKCLEYRDGWGFWAWHGVRVPEQVILTPETLRRDDFLSEQDVEVRRVIQERMGERFVRELGGQVIDVGSRGTLYEVRLPADDPEGVARYVQVQDASTSRRYFLRVPPTIQTAAEAVAWSFQGGVEDYHPAQET